MKVFLWNVPLWLSAFLASECRGNGARNDEFFGSSYAKSVARPQSLSTFASLILSMNSPVAWSHFSHPCHGHSSRLTENRNTFSRGHPILSELGTSAGPRVAVFGGRGFIGSRVCRELVDAGCDVVAISLTGKPPNWVKKEPWVQNVNWVSTDSTQDALGQLDAAVSCVGNVRPSTEWDGFWGLHWDDDTLREQNGAVNERIVHIAKSAGARRFAYVSVSSDVEFVFGGPLEGYIDGKIQATEAARKVFGDSATIIGPSLVYGGGRFAALGKLYEVLAESPPSKLVLWFLGGLETLRGDAPWSDPGNTLNKVLLTPPVDVDRAARVIAAAALGGPKSSYINGTLEIREVVAKEAGVEQLKEAAAQLVSGRAPAEDASPPTQAFPSNGAPTDENAPFEGAFLGAKPFLYPFPVAAFFIGAFNWAIANQDSLTANSAMLSQ